MSDKLFAGVLFTVLTVGTFITVIFAMYFDFKEKEMELNHNKNIKIVYCTSGYDQETKQKFPDSCPEIEEIDRNSH